MTAVRVGAIRFGPDFLGDGNLGICAGHELSELLGVAAVLFWGDTVRHAARNRVIRVVDRRRAPRQIAIGFDRAVEMSSHRPE